jgi:cyanate permease
VRAEHFTVAEALSNPRIIALALVYFGAVACNYGIGYWLPQIVKGFGVSTDATGWIVAIPYIVGTVGMVWYGRRSDARQERKGHAAVALLLCVLGYGAAAFINDPLGKMICLTVASFGTFAVLPIIWTFPTAFLSGAAAAAGIAIINALGNLSGFVGPFAMGRIVDLTGSFAGGLLLIAALALLAMVIVLLLPHNARLEEAPDAARLRAAE